MEFIFKVSYVEIYLEKIRDLLDQHRLKTNLTIREDKLKGIYIAGVTEEYVGSVDETLNVMHVGATNRAVAATGLNAGSSRSHSVFTITVVQKDTITSATKSGKLVLVDLAGIIVVLLLYTVLRYTMLYYTTLYYTMLYYAMIYYTKLCYTILYYAVLEYSIA